MRNLPRSRHLFRFPRVADPVSRRKLRPVVERVENRVLLSATTIAEFHVPTVGGQPQDIVTGPDGNLWFTTNESIGEINPTTGAITEYNVPSLPTSPDGITAGPDGNLWFTTNESISEINPTTDAVTTFDLPTPNAFPDAIAAGPDGNLWFTEGYGNQVGMINPTTDAITTFDLPTPNAFPDGIAAGPDGNLWFTESQANQIGMIDPTTDAVSEFPVTTPGSNPEGITAGPDGEVWFTEEASGQIGEINPNTDAISEFLLPNGSYPTAITEGPDSNLWFTSIGVGSVGVFNASTHAVAEYTIPINGAVEPFGITTGPDGNLWFSSVNDNADEGGYIGTISPKTQAISLFVAPNGPVPTGITADPDGDLWFTEQGADKIGVINPATDAVNEYAIPTAGAEPSTIAAGPDGNLWFTEEGSDQIGEMNPSTHAITEYSLPTYYGAEDITPGTGNMMWFSTGLNELGTIDTSTGSVTMYSLPEGEYTDALTMGADGDIYYTDEFNNALGQFDPTTNTTTEYAIPTADALPAGITAGPDGNLWFTEEQGYKIGMINPITDKITEFPLSSEDQPVGIVAGGDGDLWFTLYGAGIGEISSITDAISQFRDPNSGAILNAITAAPAGTDLWFTDSAGGIGVVVPAAATAQQLVVQNQPPSSVVVGAGFGLTVAVDDDVNNIITSFIGTVTVALANNPGGATLGGILTANVVNGMATFSGLTLSHVDNGYTLELSSNLLTPATTSAIDVGKDSTATAVSASPMHSAYGQAVTLTATVSVAAPGAGTPTGTVTFTDGSTTLGTGTLTTSNGVTSASLTAPLPFLGTQSIIATYGGDTNDQGSPSAPLSVSVGGNSTTTTVSVSPLSSVYGQSVALTATVSVVSPGTGTPTGTVTFTDGSTTLGTGTLTTSNGVTSASLTIALPTLGTQSITATYSGDTNDQPSSTVVSVTVNEYQRPIVVSDIGDYSQQNPGDNPIDTNGGISLRSAIAAAVADAAAGLADTIIFSAALNGDTLKLTQGELEFEAGSVSIAIEGGGQITVSGNDQSAVFLVDSGATVVMASLTIEAGSSASSGGITNNGTLTLSDCTIVDNSSAGSGGGILNTGTLTVVDSTLADNSAGNGGGIDNAGTLTVINSTLAGNSAGFGGAIDNTGTLTLTNSTLADNSGTEGGGIANISGGSATMNNTIVANSPSGGDLNGGAFSGAYDLIGDGSSLGSFSDSLEGNPLLAPLGNYGGPTETMALLAASPAIGAGSMNLAVDGNGSPLTTDQRGVGFARTVKGTVDIGAYESQSSAGNTEGDVYSLSNGILTDTSTDQVIASNVASFQVGEGELYYLQNNGQLWFDGDSDPVASNVATFVIDADGAAVYLETNGVLGAVTVPQPLDGSAPIVLFKMDGAGSAVVLDQNGNLIRYAPGSEQPTTLDSTVMTTMGSTTVTTSVVSFAVDGSGSVVVLLAEQTISNGSTVTTGTLDDYAPGSDIAQTLDTDVSNFVIDGDGSIVALDGATTGGVTLANGQTYQTPVYNLVRFLKDASDGSWEKEQMDTGVSTMVLNGDGSVVALDSLSESSVTLANGQVYSTPSYTMVGFAPGSTLKQTIDTDGVTQIALDGAGWVVALDSLITTPAVTLGNGQASNAPVYSLVGFAPGSLVPQVLDPNPVSRFAVDAAGAVVALDNLSVQDGTLTNGQAYNLWDIVSFSAPSYSRQLMDPSPVSTFVLDGSGTVVALESMSTTSPAVAIGSGTPNPPSPVFELVRLLPDPTPGSFARLPMTGDVSQIVVDGSGAVFALTNIESVTFGDGSADAQVISTVLYDVIRFAPGSDEGLQVDTEVKAIAVDGSGSVVVLDSPSEETLDVYEGQARNELVYSLVRFAPGSTTAQQPTMDTGVATFMVDGSGSVVALDFLGMGFDGPEGRLVLFSPGSSTLQVMDPPSAQNQFSSAEVSSFTLDGAGSVVALINQTPGNTYTLVRFVAGSTEPEQLDTNVASFVIDGSGDVVALNNGALERFAPDSNTPEPMTLTGRVASDAIAADGSVVALAEGELWDFAAGSNTGRYILGAPAGDSGQVTQFAVNGVGEVVALLADGAIYSWGPGETSLQNLTSSSTASVSSFVVDGSGSVYTLQGQSIYLYAPGSTTGQEIIYPTFAAVTISNMVTDGSGSVVALDTSGDLWIISPGSVFAKLAAGPNASTPSAPGFSVVDGFFIRQIGVDTSGSVIALVTYGFNTRQGTDENYLVRFAPGLTSVTEMSNAADPDSFFAVGSGGVIAVLAENQGLGSIPRPGYETFVYFAPGSTTGVTITDANNNPITTISAYLIDGTGAVYVLYGGQESLPGGAAATSMVYSLVRIAAGDNQGLPIFDSNDNELDYVSNFTADATGSVVILDAANGTLYRVQPGSVSPVSINYGPDNVLSFVVDGLGNVVALEANPELHERTAGAATASVVAQPESLIAYTPGSSSGVDIDCDVESYALSQGQVIALDKESGVGTVVYFSQNYDYLSSPLLVRNVLDSNYVAQMELGANGNVIALQMPNAAASVGSTFGTLVWYSALLSSASHVMGPFLINNFFVDGRGVVIATALDLDSDSTALVSFDPTASYALNTMVATLAEIQVLPDGTILALSSTNGNHGYNLYYYPPGTYTYSGSMSPIAPGIDGFSVDADVRSYTQWWNDQDTRHDELDYPAPPSFWDVLAEIVEVVGALAVTFLTSGTADPLIVFAADAGDAFLNESVNSVAFGTPFTLGSVLWSGLTGAVTANGGILDTLDDLDDAVGGVVGDVTDKLSAIGNDVGDLLGDVVDPDSFVGQALQKSFNNFVTSFVKNGNLGQAANSAFASLENSVIQGLINTTFVQQTISYLNDAVNQAIADGSSAIADNLPAYEDGLSTVEQIAADGLSGSAFGQAAASFLVNAVQDGLTGKPLFQSGLSFLDAVASAGLGNSPFAQEAVSLMNQALTSGVNASLADSLLSFLGKTAADELANSSFVQSGLSFLNEALGDGLENSSLVQSGVSFLQDIVANGLTGSSVAQEVGTFLQQSGLAGAVLSRVNSTEIASFLQEAGAEGNDFLNSTLGVDAGAFLQQAAQDGTDFLNSNFVTGASAFLDQAAQDDVDFLDSSVAGNVGTLLQDAAQAGTDFANSSLGVEIGTFLSEASEEGADFLNSDFVQQVSEFLDQVVAGDVTGSVLAESFTFSVFASSDTGTSVAEAAFSYLNQTIANGAVTSIFAQSVLPFLNQAVAAGFAGTAFAQDVSAFVSQLNSVGLTDPQDQLPGVNLTNGDFLSAIGSACISQGYESNGTSALQLSAQLEGSPSELSLSQSSVSVTAPTVESGSSITVTLTARDGDGNQQSAGGLTVVFGLGGGGGSGTFSDVTDRGNGIYTATFTGTVSGTNTITATIDGDAVTSASSGLTVTPAGVSLSQSPLSVTASTVQSGSSITVTLTAQDGGDNQETSGGLTVAFSLGGSGGSGTFSDVTDHGNGVYTAIFTGTVSGTNTITATIDGDAVTSASPALTVTPGAATQLIVMTEPPASVTVNGGFSLIVAAEDASGNITTSFDGALALELATDSGGVMLGGSPTVNAVDGVALFSGLTLNQTGAGYALSVTSDGIPTVQTSTINVDQATPQVTLSPVGMTYGTALANDQLTGTASSIGESGAIDIPGSFTYTSAAGAMLSPGSDQTESVTFTPADSTNYSSVTTTVAIYVVQATPVVSINPVSLTYGTSLANGQLGGTATWTVGGTTVNVPGSLTYTSAAGTAPAAGGGQSESVTFTPTDTTDYRAITSTVMVNVAQATPAVIVNPVNLSYGTPLANGQLGGTATWTVGSTTVNVPGSFTYTTAAASVLGAGNGQTESVTFTPTDATNYTSVTTTVIVNVAEPPVTVVGVSWITEKLAHKRSMKVLEVAFSGALDAADADDVAAYALDTATKNKKLGTRYTKPIRLKSASYTPGSTVVTLTPRGTIPKQKMQLTINASLIQDAEGRQLDGNGDGRPGGNYVSFPFSGHDAISMARTTAETQSRRVAAVIDSLLADGSLARIVRQ